MRSVAGGKLGPYKGIVTNMLATLTATPVALFRGLGPVERIVPYHSNPTQYGQDLLTSLFGSSSSGLGIKSQLSAVLWAVTFGTLLFHNSFAFAGRPGIPATHLFDTGTRSAHAIAASAVVGRTGWRQLTEDDLTHVFTGEIAFANNHIAAVLRKGVAGAAVYTLDDDGRLRALVVPVSSQDGPATHFTSARIIENSVSGVRVDAVYATESGSVTIGYGLIPGEPALQIHHGSDLSRVRVDATIRSAVVPNYFGDDVVYSAGAAGFPRPHRASGPPSVRNERLAAVTKKEAHSGGSSELRMPAEQLLLAMLDDGDALLLCVCESDEQRCWIRFAGADMDWQNDSMILEVVPSERVWIWFMAQRNVWTFDRLTSGSESFSWTPPFPARWRLTSMTKTGRTTSKRYSEEALRRVGSDPFLIYPLERDRATPLATFCVTDVMRNTLGVGPCQYIIAAERLNSGTPHDVTDWVAKQFARKAEVRAADVIKSRLDQMVTHIRQSQTLIERYRRLAQEVTAICHDAERQHSAPADAVSSVRMRANQIVQSIEIDPTELDQIEYGERPASIIIDCIGKRGGDAALDAPTRTIQRIGDVQDKTIANCRMSVRLLRLECERLQERFPDAAEFLRSVQSCLNDKTKE